MRRKYQLGSAPGDLVQVGDGEVFLHYVAQYKHLGTVFASGHALDTELSARIGAASAAFGQLSRPILCNRHLPVQVRLRLFNALIGTRLFFGLGSWVTPTLHQMHRLKTVLMRFLKKVLRIHGDPATHLSAEVIFRRAGALDPRARLALDRLLYAQKL